MKMNKSYNIIDKQEVVKEVSKEVNELFTGNDFPNQIFKHEDRSLYILECWNLFDESTYKNFINFVNSVNEDELILVPSNFGTINIDDYLKAVNQNKKRDIEFFVGIIFKPDMNFLDFNNIQKEQYYNSVNSFLYGKSKKWSFYNFTELDIMILSFDNEIKESVNKFYTNYSERILDFSELKKTVEDWSREEYRESNLNKLIQNYNKAFV